ncbi:DUF4290 domain-containing protein [Reichenbachiella sp. MALMAid0571]|uniref:DUF4290 domain-containing protein n=1 Tax=Reichenbachiella sp. MALMAid0571 TaxID=3143939 RepID=UPI0032DF0395
MMNDYNTVKERLILKEYGRNIQMLVQHLQKIEDKEERDKKAETLTILMKQINPDIKDTPEVEQKLWDDIHIISDFELDVEGPFPKPARDVLYKKPQRVAYNTNQITFKHFGKNIELLVEKATTIEDPEEQEAAIIHIGKLMKTFFYSYNKDIIDNSVVYKNIRKLSNNKLDIDMNKVNEFNLFEPQKRDLRRDNESKPRDTENRYKNKNKRPFKRRKN